MAEDLSAVVAAAVGAAGLGESDDNAGAGDGGSYGELDTSGAGGTGDAGVVAPPVEGAAVVSPTAAKPVATATEPDDLDKELDSLGIKAVDKQGRVNRIPYPNVRRTWENKTKKLTEQHQRELGERDTKLKGSEDNLTNYRRADELAIKEPERYMELLATLNPKFKEWVRAGQPGGAPAVRSGGQSAGSQVGPKPRPDAKYPDGSEGYSPEGLDALLEWTAAAAEERATARAIKQFEERFGPVEKEWKTGKEREELAPRIENQMSAMSRVWGKVFDEEAAKGDKSAIIGYMKANPGMSLELATSIVLTPRLRQSENDLRTQILNELDERPSAASSRGAGGAAGVHKPASSEPQSLADVVREATKGLK